MTRSLRALAVVLVPACLAMPRLHAQQTIEALVDQLGSTDGAERSRAYGELLRRREPALVPLLEKRIGDFPLAAQQLALYVLQQQPIETTRATYEKLAKADSMLLRVAANALLVRNGDRARIGVLAKALRDTAPADRSLVLGNVWAIQDARIADVLREYLSPTAPADVVISVLQHMQQQDHMGRDEVTASAVRALSTSPDIGVRTAALAWLAGGADEADAVALAALLRETPTRLWTIVSLLDANRKLPTKLLEAIAAAGSAPRTKYDVTAVANLLRSQAPELLTPMLQTLLGHTNDDVRTGAIEALATVPGGLDNKTLHAMLQQDAPSQQLVAAATLRRMDDDSGLAVVISLAHRPGKHLAEAARVLGGFRQRQVSEPLLLLLDDSNSAVRGAAWQSLQTVWRALFPYRRFDFAKAGYDPAAETRAPGIAALRAWWAALR